MSKVPAISNRENVINNELSPKYGFKINRKSTKFAGLKIDFSYYCPLKCNHCLFEASSSNSIQNMCDEDIFHTINSASELGTFYSITIGDQEPFVKFDKLCEILLFLKSNYHGYGVSLSTTAIWSNSYENAYNNLSVLKDLGVEQLMISVDDFHQCFVPINNCIICASAALELGINVTIQSVYSKTSHRIDYFKSLMKSYLDVNRIKWFESPLCPSGRAINAIPESEWPQLSYKDGFCSIMRNMYVAPNLSVIPCCGSGLVASGLVFGNLHEKSMYQICLEVEQDPIINMLAIYQGPAGLLKSLEEHPVWKPREYYTGTCHACFEIMNDPSLVEFLRKSYEHRKVDLFLQRLYHEVKLGLFES